VKLIGTKNRITMFWILRRTEAFLNSFNNNPSKNITRNYERRNSGEFSIHKWDATFKLFKCERDYIFNE
jgi:hypothetical protein